MCLQLCRLSRCAKLGFRIPVPGAYLLIGPKQLPFSTAAAIPVQFRTAKEVIHRVVRMQSGESVLIHAGAGGTGQALIQVAQSLGAVVFATVSCRTKRDILVKTYNIQESHIFYSRDTSFAQGVQRVTNGRGVDLIVNCLSGDSLLASWECLAPYGRFVEIGLKDIMLNANLPMMKFGSNTSFHGYDGSLWMRDHLDLARKGLEEIIDQFSMGTLHPPEPLIRHDISDVEKAFVCCKRVIVLVKSYLRYPKIH
jgi:NADPH:quinone reductase-like Zn-dependent oxidoreductase